MRVDLAVGEQRELQPRRDVVQQRLQRREER